MDTQYKSNKLRSEYAKLIDRNEDVLYKYFNPAETEKIIQKSIINYNSLIPRLPWVGGKKNPLTNNLIGSAQLLAIIMILESIGTDVLKIGEIIYSIAENNLKKTNRIFVFFIKIYMKSQIRMNRMVKASLESKKKKCMLSYTFVTSIIAQGNQ